MRGKGGELKGRVAEGRKGCHNSPVSHTIFLPINQGPVLAYMKNG
jgi:hypothetical protein